MSLNESIYIKNLTKTYKSIIHTKTDSSLLNLFRYIFPRKIKKTAVNDISFKINHGERVAFIGPNGAGKSTTIKILTGISSPTSGMVRVLGLDPVISRKKLSYEIGVVFGQTSQLWQDLSVNDSFDLLAAIFDIDNKDKIARIEELGELFDIKSCLDTPVRQLSLGQRMRCEIVASLLHNPKVLFLDEPTIGLDITAKTIIRNLIKKLAKEQNKTLLLTSHDTDDIEKVCDRVVIMNKGVIVFDDSLESLKANHIKEKNITIISDEPIGDWSHDGCRIKKYDNHKIKIRVDLRVVSVEKILKELISSYSILDLTIESPPLERIIEGFYHEK